MNNRVLCLLSGGIDSSVMLRREIACGRQVEALFFDIKQSAVRWEREATQRLCALASVDFREVSLRDWREGFPRFVEMLVVPRNLIFALLAVPYARSMSCDSVALGSTEDDADVSDSNRAAMEAFNALLHQIRQPMRLTAPWLEQRAGLKWTKTNIVKWAMQHLEPDFIRQTRSCYSSLEEPCGRCRACTNRDDAIREAEQMSMSETHLLEP